MTEVKVKEKEKAKPSSSALRSNPPTSGSRVRRLSQHLQHRVGKSNDEIQEVPSSSIPAPSSPCRSSTSSAAAATAAAAEGTTDRRYKEANRAYRERRYAEALNLYDEVAASPQPPERMFAFYGNRLGWCNKSTSVDPFLLAAGLETRTDWQVFNLTVTNTSSRIGFEKRVFTLSKC